MAKWWKTFFIVAAFVTASQALAADGPELTTSVVRINNKRYQKIVAGKSALFVPSVGLPLTSSLTDSLCPAGITAKDEVLEISKPTPANDEVKAAANDILARMAACKPAEAEKPATKAGDCANDSTAPVVGADGKVKEGTGIISTGCTKHFGN